jgi:hypothetical protein
MIPPIQRISRLVHLSFGMVSSPMLASRWIDFGLSRLAKFESDGCATEKPAVLELIASRCFQGGSGFPNMIEYWNNIRSFVHPFKLSAVRCMYSTSIFTLSFFSAARTCMLQRERKIVYLKIQTEKYVCAQSQ